MRLFVAVLVLVAIGGACRAPRASDPIERGKQVYGEKSCAACHRIGDQGGDVGPPLTHIATIAGSRATGRTAEDYLRESILDPGAYVVPGYPDTMSRGMARDLTREDLDDLVRYLLTLR